MTKAARDNDLDDTMESMKGAASNAIDAAGTAVSHIGEKLKTVGVDTDVMKDAAKEQASELQRLLVDELKRRPMRTLGVAAGVGFVLGLLATR
ncbi:MAG: hypothetical protein BGP06_15510 [Rhizobiales bacterium 65-9]|nr:DUF883 family protein [Hyphomicrobiales bacterium]OJY37899.1 MAG: hypothetical protein BGP06_15510 [Rhizobiales bacterium 65-9]